MKKNLLRTVLLAIMVLVGGNAWAETGNAVVKATYISGSDADVDTSFGEIASGGAVYCGYNKISGGAVGLANKGWGVNNIAYLQVDASAIEGTITGATLSVDCQQISARGLNYGVGYNTSAWSSTLTWNTADRSITTMGDVVNGAKTTAEKHIDFDIKDAFKNDADKIVTILVYQTAAGGGYIKNPTVTIEYTNAAVANYTVKFMCGDTEIKDAATRSGVVGEKVALENGDDAAVYANDKKYIYTGSNIDEVTVANDGSSVIIVQFREAEVYNYTLLSSLGSTITSGTGFEGDNVTVGYPRYAIAENVFYEAAATNKVFAKDIALTADNASATVNYAAKEGINAVFFAEGENIEGMTESTAGNVPIRASNAKAGVSSEDIDITTLAVGKYILHVGTFTSKTSAQTIYVGYGVTPIAFASSTNLNESASAELTLTEGTVIKYFGTTSSKDAQFDYIWIEKTGDPTEEELAAAEAAEALAAAKADFQADITAAKAIETEGKEGVEALNAAIAAAEAALNATDATLESIAAAKAALAEAIAAFNTANFDPASLIANASFEADGEKAASNGPLTLTGWTFAGVGTQFNNTELRPAGSASTTSQFGTSAPKDGEYSLFFRQGWNGNGNAITLTSDAMTELPAGDYMLSVAYKQHYSYDNTSNNNTYVVLSLVNGETTLATVKSPAAAGVNGGSGDATYFNDAEWSTLEAPVSLTEAVTGAQVVITLNAAGQRRSDFFIDDVKLVVVPGIELALVQLQSAILAAQAKADAYTIGESFFMYAASEIEPLTQAIATAQAAYNAAESKEAVEAATAALTAFVAAFAPVMTVPAADKAYTFQLRLEGETPLYMSLAEGGITIEEEATPLKFIEAETAGQYYLANEEGTLFVGLAGGDAWTMSTTADKKAAWTFTALPDGAYRINNLVTVGRFVGTNAADKEAGKPCYADKKTDNGNVDWLIAEYVAPVPAFEPSYGTLWKDGETTTDEKENTVITLDNKFFKDFVKVGDTIHVDITNVGVSTTNSRRVIPVAEISLLAGDAMVEMKNLQNDLTEVEFAIAEDILAEIQNGNNVKLAYKNLTVTKVDLVEKAPEPAKTDYTDYIVNADLKGEGGFDATGTKGIDGSGIVKVGNAAAFDFKQTIANLPAGKYKLTAQAAYRYGDSEQAEYDAMQTDAITKLVQLYATVGSKTTTQPVQNRYDGASDTDLAGEGAVVINGKYVPNSSNAVKAWFAAGKYVNEVEFNLPAEGAVTIGINRISTPASDYTVIGPWTLTRLGDAEEEPEPEPDYIDMTSFIVNNSFETGNLTGWTVGNSSDTGVRENSNPTYATIGCDGSYLFNTWWQGIPITQTITGLPKGKYELKALMTSDAGDHLFLIANGQHSEVFGSPNGKEVFVEQAMQFDVTDGTATIGAIGGNDDGTFNEAGYYWYKVDNFRLYWLDANLDELVAAYESALERAQNVSGDMNKDVQAALATAIATYGNVDKSSAKALLEATTALAEATNAANASIAAYTEAADKLAKMKELTESTNVYTQEAYDNYYGQWVVKYNEKTMTTEEGNALQNPFLVTGWHAAITCDDFLLSAWDTNPDFQDAPYYINTWSTEGESDGSEFKVPFFEYWTGDDGSLGARTLTATMLEQQNGAYNVTALVRVRMTNGAEAPAAGITLQVNDGEAVDVTTGDQIGTSQFFMGEFTAKGSVEDGELKIKFHVLDGNNISWLSFKNVKFEISTDPADCIQSIDSNLLPETIYNLNGQRVEKATKGLYIINGKKMIKK